MSDPTSTVTAAKPDEYEIRTGARVRQVPRALHPATPLYDARQEVEALRDMITDGSLNFSRESILGCLNHILRRIDTKAADWDWLVGA